MFRGCCKEEEEEEEEEEESPQSKPQPLDVLKPYHRIRPLLNPVAYVLKHEADEEELEQQRLEQERLRQEEEKRKQEEEALRLEEEKRKHQGASGQDDAVTQPSTSASETMKEAETQTNPHYFPKTSKRVTLEEILRGIQRIQMTMDHTVKDFEQRIARLERIVLKMRNAWIHHRTCHLEGLEYDDEQED